MMRDASATDDPPYFWTTMDKRDLLKEKT